MGKGKENKKKGNETLQTTKKTPKTLNMYVYSWFDFEIGN